MTSYDSYSAKTTSISYPWPAEVNGIERVALSAQGDLQRVLSAFFARPIVIGLVYSQTTRQPKPGSPFEPVQTPTRNIIEAASPTSPIIQTRQVHLQCAGKIVCTATSTVRITSPECAHLFLEENYAIGQMFRRLGKVPAFELKTVGLGPVTGEKMNASSYSTAKDEGKQLWRKYTLIIPNFECEILEVFPSREMFISGEKWLAVEDVEYDVPELLVKDVVDTASVLKQSLNIVLFAGLFLTFFYEVLMYNNGRSRSC
ncbi:hypothetical protein CPC08DRAFT_760330 [Agrocybe pediades]|nr:hypothetical protein CPC08DRAFT_760330 [Agrocybe pediades]